MHKIKFNKSKKRPPATLCSLNRLEINGHVNAFSYVLWNLHQKKKSGLNRVDLGWMWGRIYWENLSAIRKWNEFLSGDLDNV